MPVALLNEIVLLGLGLYLGYKTGTKKEQLQSKYKDIKDKLWAQ